MLILPFTNKPKLGLAAARRVSFREDISHDGVRPSQRFLKPMTNHDGIPPGMLPSARRGGAGHGLDIDAATFHRRFGHRDRRCLAHIPQASRDAPDAWREIINGLKGRSCDACLRGKAHALSSERHVPAVRAPGDLVSFDIWQACTPHANGGQRYVIFFCDHFSRFRKRATSCTRKTTQPKRSTGSSTSPTRWECG